MRQQISLITCKTSVLTVLLREGLLLCGEKALLGQFLHVLTKLLEQKNARWINNYQACMVQLRDSGFFPCSVKRRYIAKNLVSRI